MKMYFLKWAVDFFWAVGGGSGAWEVLNEAQKLWFWTEENVNYTEVSPAQVGGPLWS